MRGEGGQPAKVPAINLSTIKFSIIQTGIPKHFIEVRPIPDSSNPTRGVEAKCQGPWARAHGPKGPGHMGPRALALCLYSLDWAVAVAAEVAVAAVAGFPYQFLWGGGFPDWFRTTGSVSGLVPD